MTTHAPMAAPRQPFAALDSPRLQHLTNVKNRQMGLLASPKTYEKSPLSTITKTTPGSSTKRRLPASTFDDFDSENVDPSIFTSPSKRSKCNDSTPVKPSFALLTQPSFPSPKSAAMSAPSMSSLLQTPSQRNEANISSPRAPLTAPAGRSPKASKDLKNRRVSAPFTRIDPPSFSSRSRTSAALPFSLDAAISGTLNRSKPATPFRASTIQDSMPRNWFFDIHEDTPEEEAANLMEHSALIMDISSDEESSKKAQENKGKENMPPPDFEGPAPRSVAPAARKAKQPRRKLVKVDAMDDGERSALSDLETEDFYADGLTADSIVMVQPTPERSAATAELAKQVDSTIHAAPMTKSSEKKHSRGLSDLVDLPVVSQSGDVAGDILIWEDGCDEPASPTQTLAGDKRKKVVGEDSAVDENTNPEFAGKA